MKILIFIFFTTFAYSFEILNLYNAQKAYDNKEYLKALILLKDIKNSDEIIFKRANIYYRLKNYKKAISYYKSIKSARYNFAKFYNIANAFMKLKRYKESTVFYKEALKFKKDSKALFNLKLSLRYLKEVNKKNGKNSRKIDKADGFYSLSEGENPRFLEDDNITFNGKLAKYKNNFKIKNNISLEKRVNKDLVIELFKDKKLDKNRTLKDEKLFENIEFKWDMKLQNISDGILLIPIEED